MDMASSDSAEDAPADDGPLRTCVVTRRQEPVDRLIRFVAGPDGSVVPDLACRLPGRGIWVSLDRKAVATAVKTRAFHRGLKRELTVAPDLAEIVENLLIKRAMGALSMANKAGLVATGFTRIDSGIAAGLSIALLHAVEAAEDGANKLDRRFLAMCRDADRTPHIIRSFTNEQMSLALGRANVVHAALTMGGAAQHMLLEAERLEKYRTGRLDVD